MKTLCLSLLAVSLLLLPPAHAGTREAPEMPDAKDDAGAANAWADITRAWLERPDDETVRFTIELAQLPQPIPGHAYYVLFDAGPESYYAGLVVAFEPFLAFGTWDRESGDERGADTIEGEYTLGTPAHIVFDVPLAQLPAGTLALERLEALAVDITPGMQGKAPRVLDRAEGVQEFTLEHAPPSTAGAGTEAPAIAGAAEASGEPDTGLAKVAEAQKPMPAPAPILMLVALAAVAAARSRVR